ncbi:capsular biosynthesis protein [Ancylobacter sp. MQZ15Z-1]|uniref:Capsular biosynthesis protein n=1 Tax=Ancylobacter mangrovi TaxID=2972472 RepID=A0A9X2PBT3_9HYPH|nr:capsular biosynthesis protein [Ancylobacter mangrovi]MCS0494509.1 capsular biosynthesis protein [Ancylobacter mangrovi]
MGFVAERKALPEPRAGQERQAAGAGLHARDFAGRCFLFLQGPASPFAVRLARALRRRGARIVKVHLCGGDLVFWPDRARLYLGRLEDWPARLERLMADEAVSDVVLFGDCRPYHAPAVAIGRARGVRLHLLEEGYVRPGWITCENWGVNGHSDLPRTPEALREAASRLPEPPENRSPPAEPFARRALWDIAWHAGHAALAPLFLRYRRHTLAHPALDYVGWAARWLDAPGAARRDRAARARLADGAPHFLLPLQLEGDFQMRAHSPFGSVEEVVRLVLSSFARSAHDAARLVVKRHPYDTGLPATRRMVERVAREHDIAGRVVFVEGGDIDPLIAASSGVVLVNSTTALATLQHEKPLKVLGRATYDMPGLAHQGALDSFWNGAPPPDRDLVNAYRRVVLARTQLAGGFFAPATIGRAVESLLARMASDERVPA